MTEKMDHGTLVGFSGGADSVFLLLFLLCYKRRNGQKDLVACHVHHGIRGVEADRDAAFCRKFCSDYGIEYLEKRVDAPAYAASRKIGLEEAGRELRYLAFREVLAERQDLSSVALAHHATDNLETFFFRLLRGSGARGLSGIPPVRDEFFRPLLEIPRREIEKVLAENGVPYVIDSTNGEDDASRNYLRHHLTPVLETVNPDPEAAVTRALSSLREDDACLCALARDFLVGYGDRLPVDALSRLARPVLVRAVALFLEERGVGPLTKTHLDEATETVTEGKRRSLSLPGGTLVSDGREIFLAEDAVAPTFDAPLSEGITEFPDLGAAIAVLTGEGGIFVPERFAYYTSLVARSAAVTGNLFVRAREGGDAYRFGGMTHKVKKLIADRKIPLRDRHAIPVICDGKGPLWVPGFGIRDDGVTAERPITLVFYVREDVLPEYGWIRFTKRSDIQKG